jgi:hypothetical protein
MQNIIRDVVLSSKNNMLSVPKFLQELDKIMDEGFYINSWAKNMINKQKVEVKLTTPAKAIEDKILENSVQDFYGDAFGLTIYVGELYDSLLKNELTISITDRNPDEIEADFRKYIQHVLLDQATLSKSQKHIMVPRYTYIDKITGERIDEPNYRFMSNIENIILGSPAYTKMGGITKRAFRKEISNKYHNKVYNKIIEPTSDLIIDSSDDGLLEQFSKEYKMLLSNRRVNENINVEELKNLFYIKQNSKTDYIKYDKELRNFCEKIISNMKNNFGYSKNTALEAIIYAIDNKVIDLKNIIQKDEDSEK